MASRKRPHDSTNGINHDLEGINIRNGDSNSSSVPESSHTKANNRPVSNRHAIDFGYFLTGFIYYLSSENN